MLLFDIASSDCRDYFVPCTMYGQVLPLWGNTFTSTTVIYLRWCPTKGAERGSRNGRKKQFGFRIYVSCLVTVVVVVHLPIDYQ